MRSVIRTDEAGLWSRPALGSGLALAASICLLVAADSSAIASQREPRRLVASAKIDSVGTPRASFSGARPARSFSLVVSNPSGAQLSVKWSLRCSDPSHKASGGASGGATIVRDRWLKQVPADWIKHPSFCSGRLEAPGAGRSVQLRIYAE